MFNLMITLYHIDTISSTNNLPFFGKFRKLEATLAALLLMSAPKRPPDGSLCPCQRRNFRREYIRPAAFRPCSVPALVGADHEVLERLHRAPAGNESLPRPSPRISDDGPVNALGFLPDFYGFLCAVPHCYCPYLLLLACWAGVRLMRARTA